MYCKKFKYPKKLNEIYGDMEDNGFYGFNFPKPVPSRLKLVLKISFAIVYVAWWILTRNTLWYTVIFVYYYLILLGSVVILRVLIYWMCYLLGYKVWVLPFMFFPDNCGDYNWQLISTRKISDSVKMKVLRLAIILFATFFIGVMTMKSKERKGIVEKFGEVTEGSGKIDKLKKFEILERIEELRWD